MDAVPSQKFASMQHKQIQPVGKRVYILV